MSDDDDRRPVSAATVRRLIETQFPQWAELPVLPVDNDGWDNHSFRLGDDMKVRLPSASRYAAQVEKESQWLPRLAPHLPLPIPKPLGVGKPGQDYPWPWSIQSWLPGHPAELDGINDVEQLAYYLARFLLALQAAPANTGPPPGPHNFFRGGPLRTYDSETRDCLDQLHDDIDAHSAVEVWELALATRWEHPPVWVRGDVAVGNLLTANGRLSAVIDFGCCGVGDPACDLTIQWTFLRGPSREAFQATMQADDATLARARGWALWKALLTANRGSSRGRDAAFQVISDLCAEHRSAA